MRSWLEPHATWKWLFHIFISFVKQLHTNVVLAVNKLTLAESRKFPASFLSEIWKRLPYSPTIFHLDQIIRPLQKGVRYQMERCFLCAAEEPDLAMRSFRNEMIHVARPWCGIGVAPYQDERTFWWLLFRWNYKISKYLKICSWLNSPQGLT